MKADSPIPIPIRVFRNLQLIEFARDSLGLSREAFKEILREHTGVTDTTCLTPDGQNAVHAVLMQIAREQAMEEREDNPPTFLN